MQRYLGIFMFLSFILFTNTAAHAQPVCAYFETEYLQFQEVATGKVHDFCRFGDGPHWGDGVLLGIESVVQLYRMQKTLAVVKFLREGAPYAIDDQEHKDLQDNSLMFYNEGMRYCVSQGGEVINVMVAWKGEVLGEEGICVFKDGSKINQWALFRQDEPLKKFLEDRFPR